MHLFSHFSSLRVITSSLDDTSHGKTLVMARAISTQNPLMLPLDVWTVDPSSSTAELTVGEQHNPVNLEGVSR